MYKRTLKYRIISAITFTAIALPAIWIQAYGKDSDSIYSSDQTLKATSPVEREYQYQHSPLLANKNTLHPIKWVKNNAPPFYIKNEIGSPGIGDQLQHLFELALPNYQHSTINMPLSRLEHAWEKYQPLCFATMISGDPINDKYILSQPNLLYMPHGVITTTEHKNSLTLDSSGAVSLEQLLHSKALTMGQITGRNYSDRIDNILVVHQDDINIQERAGSSETAGILAMLESDRFDFIIEYEFVLSHYMEQTNTFGHLEFIPIQESADDLIYGAVGCSKSDYGRAAIKAINQVLPEVLISHHYRRNVGNWLVPVGREVEYWTLFNEKILAPVNSH